MLIDASLSTGFTALPDADFLADTPQGRSADSNQSRDAARAMIDLRRGSAVIVVAGGEALGFAAAETVDGAGLDDLRLWTRGRLTKLHTVWEGDHPPAPRILADDLDPSRLELRHVRGLADPLQIPIARGPHHEGRVPATAAPAAITLAKLAHLLPVLVAGRVRQDAVDLARGAGALVIDTAEIAALASARARLVRVGEAFVPLTEAANARVVAFRNPATGAEHLAVVIGTPQAEEPSRPAPLVRLHSECFTGDVLGSLRCDCGPQLQAAMRRMTEEGCGIVLYLAQEGRGIGLLNKLRSYTLQDRGLDTLDANWAMGWGADERDFSLAATMLRDLGVFRARLLTNNPEKAAALASNGIGVERASLLVAANGVNDTYLATKLTRFGHLLG